MLLLPLPCRHSSPSLLVHASILFSPHSPPEPRLMASSTARSSSFACGMALRSICSVLLMLVALSLAHHARAQSGSGTGCASSSPLVGFSADLSMIQRQLRGQIQILDDCSFKVTRFDMIAGKDVCWWGSLGEDFENLTHGFVISNEKLNRTYSNETLTITLFNRTWEQIRVLSVWDRAFDSDFGHVVLLPRDANVLAPAPSPDLNEGATSPSPSATIVWGTRQPTMFDNCIVLSPQFRLRWTLDVASETIDVGLEAAVTELQYMSFGWAKPGSSNYLMLYADVVVSGFRNRTVPFVEDYYITKYSECSWDEDTAVSGVCPDHLYVGAGEDNAVNNSKLLHGQRLDGVALVRYQRPLQSSDHRFDVPINATSIMKVIWALGPLKPPVTLRPLYLPANHGRTYGHLDLNISNGADMCTGPLEAPPTQDEGDPLLADTGSVIVVGAGPATHYPNPPNPDKVLFLNKLEAPVLKVERGVPVKFSVQAGHDVSFCITSDPVGGASITNETIIVGGSESHGVPASPYQLSWLPDRNTPDEVYYQSFYQKKMGWKVQVVDGGLRDMYNSSVFLADQMVSLFWTLTESGISFAVRGERKSGYVAIGFGEGMVNCFAYVGWVDGNGACLVKTYWIDGRDASSIHPTNEALMGVKCMQQNGIITFQFSRPLQPSCNKGQECNNNIDPSVPLKVVWAMGTHWTADKLTIRNMHSFMSSKYMAVQLTKGVAEAEQELRPVLAVHGFMMFLSWGLLLPGGILAARYLRHLKDDGWFQIHVYLQYSGIAVMLLGLLFAVAELRGLNTNSLHVKFGITGIFLACGQLANAFIRPKKAPPGERPALKRVVWQLVHMYSGRVALVVGFVGLLTGISKLGEKYGGEQMKGLDWALVAWFLGLALLVGYMEYKGAKGRKKSGDTASTKGSWVMANNEEDDSTDLLRSNHAVSVTRNEDEVQLYTSHGMEVQLEAYR